ncbi:hypothetical protein R3I94_008807 [Phoxinus phoxinus]
MQSCGFFMFQTRSRSRATRAFEKSVTVGKLQLLWDSKPAIPMAHDFSQAEAPPDGSWDEAGSPEPQSEDRPALVWVTVLPCVTPVQTDDEREVMQIIEELFPIFEELAEGNSEATALWSPEDL